MRLAQGEEAHALSPRVALLCARALTGASSSCGARAGIVASRHDDDVRATIPRVAPRGGSARAEGEIETTHADRSPTAAHPSLPPAPLSKTTQVAPFKAHKIEPPSNVVTTTADELKSFYSLMYTMRRMEIAADMVRRRG